MWLELEKKNFSGAKIISLICLSMKISGGMLPDPLDGVGTLETSQKFFLDSPLIQACQNYNHFHVVLFNCLAT